MIETAHRGFVLVSCILMVMIFTVQLFFVINPAAVKISHGSQRDNGIYPKRAKNVNAWFIPTGSNFDGAYPLITTDTSGNVKIGRLQIAPTTECPIFRAQDDGSTDPPLIG